MIVTHRRHNRNLLIYNFKMMVTYVIFQKIMVTFLFTQLFDFGNIIQPHQQMLYLPISDALPSRIIT